MITVMIHAKIKSDRIHDYLELINVLTENTTKNGCISYAFNQSVDSPEDFVLYEQWESQAFLDQHIVQLFELLGPANPGEADSKKTHGYV